MRSMGCEQQVFTRIVTTLTRSGESKGLKQAARIVPGEGLVMKVVRVVRSGLSNFEP